MEFQELKAALREALQEEGLIGVTEIAPRWQGGTLIMRPADPNQQAKEIPIARFFHKIVMLRDRLRVLEQRLNSSPKLADEEKADLQLYITRIYGTLTTFNFLFRHEHDHFHGTSA